MRNGYVKKNQSVKRASLSIIISDMYIYLRTGGLLVKFPPTVEVIARMRNTEP